VFGNAIVVENRDTSYIDEVLVPDGEFVVPSWETLKAIPLQDLVVWANLHGYYCIPTQELITWLRLQIKGKKAIEICAGHGVIGRELGIITTDSYMQTTPEMQAYYASLGQTTISPPPFVEKLEALDAVDKYHPDIVIGAFVTQKWVEGDQQGSVYGVDEEKLLRKVPEYIMIGNANSHGAKRILRHPHQQYQAGWLYTRSTAPQKNRIYHWGPSPTH